MSQIGNSSLNDNMKKDEIVAELMIKTWDSLQSHLPYISKGVRNKYMGSVQDQKKIIRDYIAQLGLLSKLL